MSSWLGNLPLFVVPRLSSRLRALFFSSFTPLKIPSFSNTTDGTLQHFRLLRRFLSSCRPAHKCSVGTDGVCVDANMVGTWMLCGNGWSLSGRYPGWHKDALWGRMESVWTLAWLAHGCSVRPDGVCVDANMVGTWMLCGDGWSLRGRKHGWHMDAL